MTTKKKLRGRSFEIEWSLAAMFNLIQWARAEGKVAVLIALLRRIVDFRGGARISVQQVRRALIDALLRHPLSVSFEGRSALLVGIPCARSLNRSPMNARMDLELIVDQLLLLGGSGSGVSSLIVFLDNAESYVHGTELARVLRDVRDALVGEREGGA